MLKDINEVIKALEYVGKHFGAPILLLGKITTIHDKITIKSYNKKVDNLYEQNH